MYFIVGIYGIIEGIPVITNEVQSITSDLKRVDLNTDPGFAPGNATFNGGPGFNMAFGFRDADDLDPRVGTWEVEYVT
jgi:hypothetical protein